MKLKKLKSSICGLFIIMLLALVNASCSNGSNEDIVSDYMVTVTAGEGGTATSERTGYSHHITPRIQEKSKNINIAQNEVKFD